MGTCEDRSLSRLAERHEQPTCTTKAKAHVMMLLYPYTSLQPVKCLTLPQKVCQDCKYWFYLSPSSYIGTQRRRMSSKRTNVPFKDVTLEQNTIYRTKNVRVKFPSHCASLQSFSSLSVLLFGRNPPLI